MTGSVDCLRGRTKAEIATLITEPNIPVEISRMIAELAASLKPGADSKEVTRAVENLISQVQKSSHPERDKIAAVLSGAIEHLEREMISSARALLALASRMAVANP
jgi:hypothetical protein